MAAVTPDIGQGLAAVYQFNGTAASTFLINNIQDVRWSGTSRDTYNAKNLSTTGAQPFLASKSYDAGEVSFSLQFDTDDANFFTAMASTVLGTLTVTWPDAEVSTLRAWCTGFEVEAGEEVMTSSARFKISTTVTV